MGQLLTRDPADPVVAVGRIFDQRKIQTCRGPIGSSAQTSLAGRLQHRPTGQLLLAEPIARQRPHIHSPGPGAGGATAAMCTRSAPARDRAVVSAPLAPTATKSFWSAVRPRRAAARAAWAKSMAAGGEQCPPSAAETARSAATATGE